MLHEAIFLATFCCETNFACNTPVLQPATATKCCVASSKKSRNILCVTCPSKPARQFCEQLGNQSPSFAPRRFQAGGKRVVNNFHPGRFKLRKNIANV